MELQKAFLEMVEADIARISEAVSSADSNICWELFREIDGKYQSCIADFYRGMWQSVPSKNYLVFHVLKDHPEQVLDNLKYAKAKLEAFRYQGNAVALPDIPTTQVNVTTNVNVTVTFEETRQKIEDMTALNREETDEIIKRIDELEAISKEKSSRKTKWEKVKPIIAFVMDKGADVAVAILTLIIQMKLGMP